MPTYNDLARYLGLPEEPDCEECGVQVRSKMQSPWTVVLKDDADQPDVHRFCGVDCAKAWLDRRASQAPST